MGKYYISIFIYNHVDYKYVCLQIVLWKQRKRKSSRYYYCSNVWDSEDWNAVLVNLLYSFTNFFIDV